MSLQYEEDSSLLTFMNRKLQTLNSNEPLIAGDQHDLSGLHLNFKETVA